MSKTIFHRLRIFPSKEHISGTSPIWPNTALDVLRIGNVVVLYLSEKKPAVPALVLTLWVGGSKNKPSSYETPLCLVSCFRAVLLETTGLEDGMLLKVTNDAWRYFSDQVLAILDVESVDHTEQTVRVSKESANAMVRFTEMGLQFGDLSGTTKRKNTRKNVLLHLRKKKGHPGAQKPSASKGSTAQKPQASKGSTADPSGPSTCETADPLELVPEEIRRSEKGRKMIRHVVSRL